MENDMTGHFNYLIEDRTRDFMQKVALSPVPHWQTPGGFEEFSAQLERDMGILKKAALSSPEDMAANIRANAYLDRLEASVDPDEFAEAFDKVAVWAIQEDIARARFELCKTASDPGWVEAELCALGRELVKLAVLEKQAVAGGRIARLFARGAGLRAATPGALRAGARAAGKGYTAIGGAVRKAPGAAARQAKRPFSATAKGFRQVRVGLGQSAIRGIRHALKKETAKPFTPGSAAARRSLAASLKKKKEGLKGLMKRPEYREAESARRARLQPGAAKPAPAPRPAGKQTKELRQRQRDISAKSEAQRFEAAEGAQRATMRSPAPAPGRTPPTAEAGPAEGKSVKKKKKGKAEDEGGSPTTAKSEAGGKAGLLAPFEKAIGSGYKSLTPEEKASLWRRTGAGLLGYRALSGSGAVTGGEGVI